MQRIYYSRLGLPDNIEETGTADFTIRWEVSYKEGERDQIDAHSYDEIQELLLHKVESILKEKNSDLARIVQSSVHHKKPNTTRGFLKLPAITRRCCTA